GDHPARPTRRRAQADFRAAPRGHPSRSGLARRAPGRQTHAKRGRRNAGPQDERRGAMSVYFDASVLVALFTIDPFTERAKAFMRSTMPTPVVRGFAAAECASAVARRVSTKDLRRAQARSAFASCDAWTAKL